MFNFDEIKQQNKMDAFSAMFACVGGSVVSAFGELEGESLIRECVRRAGWDSGLLLREKHSKAGIPVNLRSLYHCGRDCFFDPRFRGAQIADEEERQIWEVYCCPMAHFWNGRGAERIGTCFCEEYERARVLAYTGGAGQLNLSNRKTCGRDDFCLFAAFFREANCLGSVAGAAEAAESETYSRSAPIVPPAAAEIAPEAESVGKLTASICFHFYETAEERFGEDGVSAVRAGLAAWAAEAVAALKSQAERTLKRMDAEFVRKNFPLALDAGTDAAWDGYRDGGAAALADACVLAAVREACGGFEAADCDLNAADGDSRLCAADGNSDAAVGEAR